MTVGVVERRPPLIISASGVAATSSRPAAVIRIVPFLLSHVCVGGTVWGWAPSSSFGSVVPLALGRHLGQFQQDCKVLVIMNPDIFKSRGDIRVGDKVLRSSAGSSWTEASGMSSRPELMTANLSERM